MKRKWMWSYMRRTAGWCENTDQKHLSIFQNQANSIYAHSWHRHFKHIKTIKIRLLKSQDYLWWWPLYYIIRQLSIMALYNEFLFNIHGQGATHYPCNWKEKNKVIHRSLLTKWRWNQFIHNTKMSFRNGWLIYWND
jgi:hypothetical protein